MISTSRSWVTAMIERRDVSTALSSRAMSARTPLLASLVLIIGSMAPAFGSTPPDASAPQPALTLKAQCGAPFQDNGVLQQNMPLPVWGTSLSGAKVTVEFEAQKKTAIAAANGSWRVVLEPLKAVPLTSVRQHPSGSAMTIACEKDGRRAIRKITNLVAGEVWICSGQSNMAGSMRTIIVKLKGGILHPDGLVKSHKLPYFPADSISSANYPGIRQFVPENPQPWLVCSPETVPGFKKVAYFFGRRLFRDIKIPVGLIVAAKGGSRIEPWLVRNGQEMGAHFRKYMTPVIPYGIQGVLWYQGESNEKDGRRYLPKLRSLITGWREAWQQPSAADAGSPQREFPFYFVQLPGLRTSSLDNPAGSDGRAEIRQAYFDALEIKNTGMAITLDIGDVKEHPPCKIDTGVRLARLALHNVYGRRSLVPSGPLYKSHAIEGPTVRITFDHAQNGLMLARKKGYLPPNEVTDSPLQWLAVKSHDGSWHWAEAQIVGSELIVSSKNVLKPVAARYAYTANPAGVLLYNKDGLPAGPFTTCGYDPEPRD